VLETQGRDVGFYVAAMLMKEMINNPLYPCKLAGFSSLMPWDSKEVV